MTTERQSQVFFSNFSSGQDIVMAVVCHVNTDQLNDRETFLVPPVGKHGQNLAGTIKYTTGFQMLGSDQFKFYWLTKDGCVYTTDTESIYPTFLAGLKFLQHRVQNLGAEKGWFHSIEGIVLDVLKTAKKVAPKLEHILDELKKADLAEVLHDKNKLKHFWDELVDVLKDLANEPEWKPVSLEEKAFYLVALGEAHMNAEVVGSISGILKNDPKSTGDIGDLVGGFLGWGYMGYEKFTLHPSDDIGIEFGVARNEFRMGSPSGKKSLPYRKLF